jgi:hypothetical protein
MMLIPYQFKILRSVMVRPKRFNGYLEPMQGVRVYYQLRQWELFPA